MWLTTLKDAWHDWRLANRLERERVRWREQRMRAVREAASEGLFAPSSLVDGLRVIQKFEQINGCTFDPNNDYHLMLITNMGWGFALDRKLRALASCDTHPKGVAKPDAQPPPSY